MFKSKLITAAVAATIAMASPVLADYKPLKGDPKEINFGIISTESTANLKQQWKPFLDDMEKYVGMKINAFYAPDYAGVIEAMRFGKVTVAWFGNKSGMEAVDRAGGEVFAQQANADGSQGYYSHIITQADNKDINSLEDLFAKCDRTLNFGIGDPNSTSGFLVPSYYVFARNNVDPKKCFRTVRNANHETNLMATANGQVDAATNNSEQIQRSKLKAPKAAAAIKIIWTSPQIPSDPIIYRKDLSKEMKSRIRAFFMTYGRFGTPAEVKHARAVLKNMSDLGPFVASTDAQLYPIRQLALFKNKIKLQGNPRIGAAEKKKQLAAIDAKLALVSQLVKGF